MHSSPDPQSTPLNAAQRAKIRRLSSAQANAPGEGAGELNIVPYLDIIMNILLFVLVTVSVTFVSSIAMSAPERGGKGPRPPVPKNALELSAIVTADGVALKTSKGNVAPG